MIPIRVPCDDIWSLCTRDMTNCLAFSKLFPPTEPERSIITPMSIGRLQDEGAPGAERKRKDLIFFSRLFGVSLRKKKQFTYFLKYFLNATNMFANSSVFLQATILL